MSPRCRYLSFFFLNAISFNQDLSAWNVSSVTGAVGFLGMFHTALDFNGDITTWDVSNNADPPGMFFMAESFNQDISSWDASNFLETDLMFYRAKAFNQDISAWDLSSLHNADSMFTYSENFNQDLCDWSNVWGERDLYIRSRRMFSPTGCNFQEDPVEAQGGPFCASDCQE